MQVVIFVALFVLALTQTPEAPIYPPVSSWQFFETQITTSTATTYGSAFYDSVNELYRQDRFSGETDVMCAGGLPLTTDTLCSTLVVGGYRYLYYPGLSQCCYCCSDADGCGVLSPNWLDGAEYIGQSELYGQSVYGWNQSSHVYFESAEVNPSNRVPVGLNIDFADIFEYYVYEPTVPSNAFDLPSECGLTKVCAGLCQVFRGSGAETSFN